MRLKNRLVPSTSDVNSPKVSLKIKTTGQLIWGVQRVSNKIHTPPTSGSREPQLVIGFRGSRQPLSRDSPFYTFLEHPKRLKKTPLLPVLLPSHIQSVHPRSRAHPVCIKIYTGAGGFYHEYKPAVCPLQQLQLFPWRYQTHPGKTATPEPNQGAITEAPWQLPGRPGINKSKTCRADAMISSPCSSLLNVCQNLPLYQVTEMLFRQVTVPMIMPEHYPEIHFQPLRVLRTAAGLPWQIPFSTLGKNYQSSFHQSTTGLPSH